MFSPPNEESGLPSRLAQTEPLAFRVPGWHRRTQSLRAWTDVLALSALVLGDTPTVRRTTQSVDARTGSAAVNCAVLG